MTVVLVCAGLAILVLISGFMAAAETAISQTPRSELERQAEESRNASALTAIAEHPDAHTNALVFLRTLLETMMVALVALSLTAVFESEWKAFLTTVGIMLVVTFIVTGASPRSVGRANGAKLLAMTAPLVRGIRILVGPAADLLVAIGDRVTPGRPARTGALTSEDQLLNMIDEAADMDVLEEEDRALLHSVFDFSDTLVREVMVARTDMVTISDEETIQEALMSLLDAGYSRAPITGRDSDDVLGVVYTKDLAQAVLASGDVDRPCTELARPARFVPESLGAETLLRQMQQAARHFALVVDEYGGIAGLVTLEDLIEELVGDIHDEYDRGRSGLVEVSRGVWRAPSRMSLADISQELDIELDDDDVDSIGGLLAKALGKIPSVGEVAVADGIEITAERAGRRGRIETVLVRQLSERELLQLAEAAARDDDVVDQTLQDLTEHSVTERESEAS